MCTLHISLFNFPHDNVMARRLLRQVRMADGDAPPVRRMRSVGEVVTRRHFGTGGQKPAFL